MVIRPSGLTAPASSSATVAVQSSNRTRASGASARSTRNVSPAAVALPHPMGPLPPSSERGARIGRAAIATPRSTAGSSARGARHPDLPTRRDDQRIGAAREQGDRGDDDVGSGSAGGKRSQPELAQLVRRPVGSDADRMQPIGDVVVGGRDEIGDTRLGRTPGAGQHRQRSGMSGRRIATRLEAAVRSAPVERFVGPMPDGGERQVAPAEDPVDDLEPAPDDDLPGGSIGEAQVGPGEWLAGRHHPADRRAGRPLAGRVAPAVAEPRDHDVADRTRLPEVDRELAVDEDPASPGGPGPELERQPAEHRRTIRQTPESRPVLRIKAVREIGVGGIPERRQADRPSQRSREPRLLHGSGPPAVFDVGRAPMVPSLQSVAQGRIRRWRLSG